MGLLEKINHLTKLVCPDSETNDYAYALQTSFWLDEGDVWHIDCGVCGGEHCVGDVLAEIQD